MRSRASATHPFPSTASEIRAQRMDGKLVLRFPLGAREQLYGLG